MRPSLAPNVSSLDITLVQLQSVLVPLQGPLSAGHTSCSCLPVTSFLSSLPAVTLHNKDIIIIIILYFIIKLFKLLFT